VALKIRFAPSDYNDPVGAFTKLQQTSTVDEYQSQFKVLSNRILGLTEYFRMSSFVSGLKDEVQIMVTMLKPTTLPNALGWLDCKNKKFAGGTETPSPNIGLPTHFTLDCQPHPTPTNLSTTNQPAIHPHTPTQTETPLTPTPITPSESLPYL